MIENLDAPIQPPVVRFVKHKRTGEIIVLTSPKHFSPIDHEWYEPAAEVKTEAPAEETKKVAAVENAEEARFEELKAARVWLHGTEEEKAEYETLKTKLGK